MVSSNITTILSDIPENVKLIAVSKTKTEKDIMEAYQVGQMRFGENKVQELLTKYESLPKNIEWHLVGHLQSNKVKYIAPFISLIHSVDSIKLLEIIDKEAQKINRVIDCLLQLFIADESTKYGLDETEFHNLLNSGIIIKLNNIRICGLMGIATFTEDKLKIKNEFRRLYELFQYTKKNYFLNIDGFKELSMGMSQDYKIAIDEGSTMIRLGSVIFGERVSL
jgi:PLP dependent protein